MNAGHPKLLLFSHICNPTQYTGAEKVLMLFMIEMQQLYNCVLVVPNEGVISREARNRGIEVRVLDIPLSIAMYVAAPHLGAELHQLRHSPTWGPLIALLQSERPDYVWVNTCVHPLPAMAAKKLGIPVIWTIMETILAGPSQAEAVGFIHAYSDRIVGVSRAVLGPFPQEIVAAKATVLSPFIDRETLNPDGWPLNRHTQRRSNGWGEHHRVIGFIASTIYRNKGLLEFLQAVLPVAAHDSRVRLLIVGNPTDGPYVEECKELIRQTGMADRAAWVEFTPGIEHVYPAMDVVVVPSLVPEGFGMAALEGMIFGKPVVSFASGGLAEIHEATGNVDYMVEPGNIAGLSGMIAGLVKNETLREEVGRQNAQAASERFGVEAFRRNLDSFAVSLQGIGYRMQGVAEQPDAYLALIGAPMTLPAARKRRSKRRTIHRRAAGRRRHKAGRRVKRAKPLNRRLRRIKRMRRIRRIRRVGRIRRVRRIRTVRRIKRSGRIRRIRRIRKRP